MYKFQSLNMESILKHQTFVHDVYACHILTHCSIGFSIYTTLCLIIRSAAYDVLVNNTGSHLQPRSLHIPDVII